MRTETLDALRCLNSFPQGKVLVIGDLILDRYIWGCVDRISPEAPVPVVKVERESVHLGGASNVLGNLCSMGGQAFLVGVVGNDPNGQLILTMMRELGADTSGVVLSDGFPTIQKTRIIAHQQQVVRVDREKEEPFDVELQTRVLESVKQQISKVDAVIISDYGKGVISPELLQMLTQLDQKPLICVDPKDANFNHYHDVHILTPNQAEAERMSGVRIRDRESLMLAADRIFDVLNCESLLITRGEKGMALFESRDALYEIPTQAREVYDVSGAGDTVIASYALTRAIGGSTRTSAYLANAAAGIVVGKLGTAEVYPQEIKACLERQLAQHHE